MSGKFCTICNAATRFACKIQIQLKMHSLNALLLLLLWVALNGGNNNQVFVLTAGRVPLFNRYIAGFIAYMLQFSSTQLRSQCKLQ